MTMIGRIGATESVDIQGKERSLRVAKATKEQMRILWFNL